MVWLLGYWPSAPGGIWCQCSNRAAQKPPAAVLEVRGRTRCLLSRRGIIASPILRPVVEVLVGPGDRVTKGQTLIKLYDAEPQAKVRARENEFKSIEARARLTRRNLDLAEKSRSTGALPETSYNEIRATALSNEAQARRRRRNWLSPRVNSNCIP